MQIMACNCYGFSVTCSLCLRSRCSLRNSQKRLIHARTSIINTAARNIWHFNGNIILLFSSKYVYIKVTITKRLHVRWWCHDSETVSVFHCSLVNFPHKEPEMETFDVSFVVSVNKLLNKHWSCQRFEICNVTIISYHLSVMMRKVLRNRKCHGYNFTIIVSIGGCHGDSLWYTASHD